MTTGERIKAARKHAGFTQQQLADIMGIKQQTIAMWENNFRKPRLETLLRIADPLGIRVQELLPPEESGSLFIQLPDEESDRLAEEGKQLIQYTLGERGRKLAVEFMRELTYNPDNLLVNDKRMIRIPREGEEPAENGQHTGEDE